MLCTSTYYFIKNILFISGSCFLLYNIVLILLDRPCSIVLCSICCLFLACGNAWVYQHLDFGFTFFSLDKGDMCFTHKVGTYFN